MLTLSYSISDVRAAHGPALPDASMPAGRTITIGVPQAVPSAGPGRRSSCGTPVVVRLAGRRTGAAVNVLALEPISGGRGLPRTLDHHTSIGFSELPVNAFNSIEEPTCKGLRNFSCERFARIDIDRKEGGVIPGVKVRPRVLPMYPAGPPESIGAVRHRPEQDPHFEDRGEFPKVALDLIIIDRKGASTLEHQTLAINRGCKVTPWCPVHSPQY